MIRDHLELAEAHVAQGKEHLVKQRALIARLSEDGHNTEVAEVLLRQLESTLATHEADRDRLIAELSQADGETGAR